MLGAKSCWRERGESQDPPPLYETLILLQTNHPQHPTPTLLIHVTSLEIEQVMHELAIFRPRQGSAAPAK